MNAEGEGRRLHRTLTPAERERKLAAIAETEAQRDDAADMERFRRRQAALAEESFSGELRRAIHSVDLPPFQLQPRLAAVGVSWDDLTAFMLGEASLPSAAVDRIMAALGLKVALSHAGSVADERE